MPIDSESVVMDPLTSGETHGGFLLWHELSYVVYGVRLPLCCSWTFKNLKPCFLCQYSKEYMGSGVLQRSLLVQFWMIKMMSVHIRLFLLGFKLTILNMSRVLFGVVSTQTNIFLILTIIL